MLEGQGFNPTILSPRGAATVDELLAEATAVVASIRASDVVVTMPRTAVHAYADEAAFYGVPVVSLADLIGATA
jgi:hypothetical protein